MSLSETFEAKYAADSDWGGHSSGPGSDPYYNLAYRQFLENFLYQNGICYAVDIGCGDWSFSRYIRFDGISYRGFDVASTVIAQNNATFASSNVSFDIMPEKKEDVPGADLLIMKDVLQHLSNKEIIDFYQNVFPKFTYCLITNSYRKLGVPSNTDIENGGFRPLNLQLQPFNFKGAYVLQFTTGVWEEVRTILLQNLG